jgi:beta-lactamase regulating signal transducer with metallopeptidase domain
MINPEISGWLLTYTVHSTVLLLGAWLIADRVHSHRVREALWKTALFGGFVTATGQTLLQVRPLAGRMVVPAAAIRSLPAPDASGTPPQSFAAKSDEKAAVLTANGTASIVPSRPLPRGGDLLVVGWAIGATLLLGFYAVRRARFARRIAPRRLVANGPVAEMLEELRLAAGMARPVRLTASAALPSPVALGATEIAVPEAALTELDEGQQRGMMAHELAHLDRRDPSWLTAACIAERIGFFQPLNRLARRRMQESAEYLCDEWAVRRTGSGVLLAKCLAKVAEWLDAAPQSVPVAGMAEDRSHLVARVRRLLDGAPFPAAPGRKTLVVASLSAMAVTVLALPAVSLAHRQGDTTPDRRVEQPSLFGDRPAREGSDSNRAIVLALIGVLHDPNVEVRRAAVNSLGNFEDRTAAPALREALKDEDAEVRAGALEALGNLEDAASADAIAALLRDPNKEVRAKAIEALSDLELTSPPAGLLDALKDADAEVRQQAAHAVGHFEDARAVPVLRSMLDDPNGEVREAAVEALSDIRNEAAIQALIGALKARDPKVRQAAADALGKRGER